MGGRKHAPARVAAERPRLVLGPADDTHERAADQAADGHPPDRRPVRRAGGGDTPLDPAVEDAILGARHQGRPLARTQRIPLEQRLGADLGDVRVHTDQRADDLSRLLQARAFTTGRDIFFRRGEHQLGGSGGEVLAHEAAHVVQQTGPGGTAGGSSGSPAPVQRAFSHDSWTLSKLKVREIFDGLKPRARHQRWYAAYLGQAGKREPVDITEWLSAQDAFAGVDFADLLVDRPPSPEPEPDLRTPPSRSLTAKRRHVSPKDTTNPSPRKKKLATPTSHPTTSTYRPPNSLRDPISSTYRLPPPRDDLLTSQRPLPTSPYVPPSFPRSQGTPFSPSFSTPLPRSFSTPRPKSIPSTPLSPSPTPIPKSQPLLGTTPEPLPKSILPTSLSPSPSPIPRSQPLPTSLLQSPLGPSPLPSSLTSPQPVGYKPFRPPPIPPDRFYGTGPTTGGSPLTLKSKASPPRTPSGPTSPKGKTGSPKRGSPTGSPSGRKGPRRLPDGTYRDPALPGRMLLLSGRPGLGSEVFQIVGPDNAEFRYDQSGYHIVPGDKATTPDHLMRLAHTDSPTRWPQQGSGSPGGRPDPATSHAQASIGTYADPFHLVRLHRVLRPYGSDVIRRTLAAKSTDDLQAIAGRVKSDVAALKPHAVLRLLEVKPSLGWFLKTGTRNYGQWQEAPAAGEVADKAFNEYLGTVGELLDEFRLRRRIGAAAEQREWLVVPHGGGSGAGGPDMIVVKKTPDGFRFRPHEVKLTTRSAHNQATYGYGDGSGTPSTSGTAPGGMPVLYRSNYLPTGGLRPTPVKAYEKQRDVWPVHTYLGTNIRGSAPDEAANEIGGDPRARHVSWKYSTFGHAGVDPTIRVPQTHLGERSARATNPLKPWLDEMGTWTSIGHTVHAIVRAADIDRQELATVTTSDAKRLLAVLDQLVAALKASKDWPLAKIAELVPELRDLAQPSPLSSPTVATKAAAYLPLLATDMTKKVVRSRYAGWR